MGWNNAKFESIRQHINAALKELRELEAAGPPRDETSAQCLECGGEIGADPVGGFNGPEGSGEIFECLSCGHRSQTFKPAPPPPKKKDDYVAPALREVKLGERQQVRMCSMCLAILEINRQCPNCIGPVVGKAVR